MGIMGRWSQRGIRGADEFHGQVVTRCITDTVGTKSRWSQGDNSDSGDYRYCRWFTRCITDTVGTTSM
jgi:hypothetical protein